MKNVAFVTLNTGGTKGHHSFIRKCLKSIEDSANLFVIADNKETISDRVNHISITSQRHMNTVGGCFTYQYGDEIIEAIHNNRIDVIIFSTFFDSRLIKRIQEKGTQTVYMSYPLRDSHMEALRVRNSLCHFSNVIWLSDIIPQFPLLENELMASVVLEPSYPKGNTGKILISCGGGGRPSSKTFYSIVQTILPKLSQFDITIIDRNNQIENIPANCNVLQWSDSFPSLIDESSMLLGEAGYHTVSEIINAKTPAVLIPGMRRIDNQELRAVYFEKLGCGKFFLPEENPENLFQMVHETMRGDHDFEEARGLLFAHESLDQVLRKVIL